MKTRKELIIFITFFAIFIATTILVRFIPQIDSYETKIISFTQDLFKNISVDIAIFITKFGHEEFWRYAVIFCSALLIFSKKIKELIIFLISIPFVTYAYSYIKAIIERPRPDIEYRLIDIANFSFPSGHSAISIVTYGILIYFIYKLVANKPLKIILIVSLSLLIALIGFTRVWLGVHYPTDVIGGFSLGICLICILVLVYKKLCNLRFTK